MDRREFIVALGAVAGFAPMSQAYARFGGGAFLDQAIPGVGLTVSGSPRELRLHFNLGVVAAMSSVEVMTSAGAEIPVGRPVGDPADQQTVTVKLGRPLSPGVYTVRWHMVSIRARPTTGAYRFTVS
jgi:hypothetical protein